MTDSKMTFFSLINGTALYSETATVEDGVVRFKAKETCLVNLKPGEKGLQVEAVPMVRFVFSPTEIRVPLAVIVQMTDVNDKGAQDLFHSKMAEAPMVKASTGPRLVKGNR